ncbi:DJ-1/PfpI family protein [Clostridium sp. MSJ-4]|uniref:DJ-1/PfpI family protein n=1 Tax=Clostridium simiarum TaxID=2841506 RepID=A0ABS6EY27_9CLOT|nr:MULTISPECIES: DJ-1 family glyoxalase III [Clostridium]MBU5591134.1 DJ-1/PfpI family protein [Clostridium simiarum]
MKKVLVFLAEGFEEIEALTVVDVLRRAEVTCDTCSLNDEYIKGAHGIEVKADKNIMDEDLKTYDAVILPGGMPGAENLKNNTRVLETIKEFYANGKLVGAICAAPIALEEAGIIKGTKVTSYPSFREKLGNSIYKEEAVVEDVNILTSRGPYTALEFAYAILTKLGEEEKVDELKDSMLYNMYKK